MASKRMIEQRKNIIKDVVKQLNTKRLIARSGDYLFSTEEAYNSQFKDFEEQKYVTPEKECYVCAIGSLFISAVDRYNKLNTNQIEGYYDYSVFSNQDDKYLVEGFSLVEYLSKWWPEEELRLIETAFEGSYHGNEEEEAWEDSSLVSKAITWHIKKISKKVDNEDDFILREICKKLLKHPECLFRTR